jgi:Electron transfer DM13
MVQIWNVVVVVVVVRQHIQQTRHETPALSTSSLTILCLVVFLSSVAVEDVAEEPLFLGSLSSQGHLVSGDVWLLSEKILEIRNFTYDGTAPATYFWLDTSPTPSETGMIVQDGFPSLGCALSTSDPTLPEALGVSQRVEFPGDLSIFNFLGGSLSVWCVEFSANFGSIVFNETLPGPVPSSGAETECADDDSVGIPEMFVTPEGFNCEELNPKEAPIGGAPLQVRWKVDGDWLDVELVGRLLENEYFGFGVSGFPNERTEMIGADVQIAVSQCSLMIPIDVLQVAMRCPRLTFSCANLARHESTCSMVNPVSEISI